VRLGKRATLADANNHLSTYVYDGLDRQTALQYPSSNPSLHTSDSRNYGDMISIA
jgi:hypothetical protein